MTLSMRRIVLFTKDMPGMTKFYRDVLGLKVRKDEKGWKEFDANGCIIISGEYSIERDPPAIVKKFIQDLISNVAFEFTIKNQILIEGNVIRGQCRFISHFAPIRVLLVERSS